MEANHTAISVAGLRKSYQDVIAVDGVTFQVEKGEIFGMVGPNGSGKTTTIECIEGLRQPDEGKISVLDLDPVKEFYKLREITGIQLQASELPRRMRVGEALHLFASFYRQSRDWRQLMERLGLADKQRVYFNQLSGGQQQRLFVALALINTPKVVFLDELTTGLDPQARHRIWELVREIRDQGATVFLTTHYMDEAERLCDRVGIIDQGRIIALDTPQHLVQRLGMATRISFRVNGGARYGKNGHRKGTPTSFDEAKITVLEGVQSVEQQGDQVILYGQGAQLISAVVNTLDREGITFDNLRGETANLEDVFLALTGRQIEN